jgi:hypothetical protein
MLAVPRSALYWTSCASMVLCCMALPGHATNRRSRCMQHVLSAGASKSRQVAPLQRRHVLVVFSIIKSILRGGQQAVWCHSE